MEVLNCRLVGEFGEELHPCCKDASTSKHRSYFFFYFFSS